MVLTVILVIFYYFCQKHRKFFINFQQTRCVNQIEDVCRDVERTINQTIQNTLNTLEKDCDTIASLVEKQLEKDDLDRSYNFKTSGRGKKF